MEPIYYILSTIYCIVAFDADFESDMDVPGQEGPVSSGFNAGWKAKIIFVDFPLKWHVVWQKIIYYIVLRMTYIVQDLERQFVTIVWIPTPFYN